MNRSALNCISYWLPRIEGHVPTPHTSLVKLPGPESELMDSLDGKLSPAWWMDFIAELRHEASVISQAGPWFLRTGVFSGKHRWRECCAVTNLDRIGQHTAALFEFSQIVDFMGLPCDIWAVREWLPGPALCEYEPFRGMPIRREFRVFAEAGQVHCIHPYWPAGAVDQLTEEQTDELERMNDFANVRSEIVRLAEIASRKVDGAWSIDCLSTDSGWYITDMAVAEQSYHWPDCLENRWNPERSES